MPDLLATLLADLAAETAQLDDLVAGLDPEGWRTPTPATGWDVADQIAHLAWTDGAAVAAMADGPAWQQIVETLLADPEGAVDDVAHAGAAVAPADLLRSWRDGRAALAVALRSYPRHARMPWFGPPMGAASMATARFMETWAHGLDVAEALDAESEPTDRVRHVAHLGVRTRDFAFAQHGEPAPSEELSVTLVSPSGDVWSWGSPDAAQTVTGSAVDFALLVTRRRHRDDLDLVAVGADADRWLDIAQAFAGPSGTGRERTGG